MEKIHYERQNKLEQIATEMYKNSVLVRSNIEQKRKQVYIHVSS